MTDLRSLIRDAGPEGTNFSDPQQTLTRAEMADLVDAVKARIAAAGMDGKRLCLALDASLGSLAALVAVLETGTSGALILRPAPDVAPDWPAFCDGVLQPALAGQGTETAHNSAQAAASPADDGLDRVFLRTSGTTGAPKWAVHTTEKLLGNARAVVDRLGLTGADRVLIPVPIHHMFGLGAALLPSLLAGASIHLAPRGNPLELVTAARAFSPTAAFMVPSQCRSVMALRRSLGQMRMIVVAGDRLAAAEAQAFETGHGPVVALYGSTEMGAMTASNPGDPQALRHLTAGPPMEGMVLALGDEVPDAAAEGARPMRLRAAYGLLGYCDADGRLISEAGEVWTTGDLVRLHDGNRVEVLGRADHAVNRDGLLVHMGDIEGAMARCPGVALAAVISAGQTRRGAGLVAFCTLTGPGASDEEAILGGLRAELPPRAVPDRLVILTNMPMLPSGKVDRRSLTTEGRQIMDG